jgi:hypothetical protein
MLWRNPDLVCGLSRQPGRMSDLPPDTGVGLPVKTAPDAGRLRRWLAGWRGGTVVAVIVVAAIVFIVAMQYHGNPDPGGRRMAAVRPVLSVVPSGLTITNRDQVKPSWDSCDGKHPGWDPVTVDVGFIAPGQSAAQIYAHIAHGMARLGWTYDLTSTDGAWTWHRHLGPHEVGEAQLLGGANPWDLQASVPAATHPIDC